MNSPLVEPLTPNLATVRGAHNFLFFLIIQSVLHSFMSCGLLFKHVLCHDSGLLKFNTARPLVPNSVGPLVLIPPCVSYPSVPLKFEIHSLGYTENTIGYSNSRKRFSLLVWSLSFNIRDRPDSEFPKVILKEWVILELLNNHLLILLYDFRRLQNVNLRCC